MSIDEFCEEITRIRTVMLRSVDGCDGAAILGAAAEIAAAIICLAAKGDRGSALDMVGAQDQALRLMVSDHFDGEWGELQ